MTRNGKDINDVLNMPYPFFLELLRNEKEEKEAEMQEKSLIAAFKPN